MNLKYIDSQSRVLNYCWNKNNNHHACRNRFLLVSFPHVWHQTQYRVTEKFDSGVWFVYSIFYSWFFLVLVIGDKTMIMLLFFFHRISGFEGYLGFKEDLCRVIKHSDDTPTNKICRRAPQAAHERDRIVIEIVQSKHGLVFLFLVPTVLFRTLIKGQNNAESG